MSIEPLLQLTQKLVQKLDVSSNEMLKKNEALIEKSEGLLQRIVFWTEEKKIT